MVFARFFRPKWQHNDPDVRKQALDSIPSSNLEVLGEMAWNDPSPNLRRLAVRKLDDLQLLSQLATRNTDAGTRDYATLQLRTVISGERGTASAEQRLTAAQRLTGDANLMNYLAESGKEVELRELALQHCDDQKVLGQVAIGDAIAAVRRTAVERISDVDVLDRVFREARKRDKQVSRIAKERLDVHHSEQERPRQLRAQAESVCERLALLGKSAQWEHDKASLEHLESQWQESLEVVDVDLAERYKQLHASFLEGYENYLASRREQSEAEQHYAPIRSVRDEVLALFEHLEQQLRQQQQLDQEQYQTISAQLAETELLWKHTGHLSDEEEKRYQQRYDERLIPLQERLEQLFSATAVRLQAQQMLREAEELVAQKRPIGKGKVEQLSRRWSKLNLPKGNEQLVVRFAEQEKQLRSRLESQTGQIDARLDELPALLDELEQAIGEGAARVAAPLHDKLQARLHDLVDMDAPRQALEPLELRFKQLSVEVRELRNWRKWASDREREKLVDEMEALADSELPAEVQAEQVQALQQQWKALESGGNPASKAIWQRFQEAGHRAYQPVKAHEAELAEQRKQNAAIRSEFLDRLAEQLEQIDWKSIDWKQAMRAERDLLNQWCNLGAVERKQRRSLDKRFDGYLAIYRGKLDGERERNLRMREELIRKVEALMEVEDVQQAIDQVKGLQKQWITTVTGRRKEENQIWQRFRAACDAVYGRRQQQREAEQQELEENLARKQALVKEAEALAECDYDGLRQAESELQRIRAEFDDIGHVPKSAVREISDQLNSAIEALARRADALRSEWSEGQIAALIHHAEVASAFEQRLLGAESLDLNEVEAAQSEMLAALTAESERSVAEARFARLLAAADGSRPYEDDELAEIRRQREELCLRMEILAGVDSPPEAAQARMAYQVNRLSQAMAEGRQDSRQDAYVMEREWYGLSPLSADDVALSERFNRARDAFHQALKS